VLAAQGGPVERLEEGRVAAFGHNYFQANAFLRNSLVARRPLGIYCDADGSGMHRSPMVARHIAISECIERWAYHETLNSATRAEFCFDVDCSSNGMAAFPGLSINPARQAARFEAFERSSIFNWWERRIDGNLRATRWPRVSAVLFGPFVGTVAVILFTRSKLGFYAYGHAAADSFERACDRAMMELCRHESAIHSWSIKGMVPIEDRFERRARFFSSDEGFAIFEDRLKTKVGGSNALSAIICDSEIRGPWSSYATVWRFLFPPPSDRFTADGDGYFFW
jgi:ribosomal protein S12 methylthiotransferase accessory factor YcaO